MIVSPMSLKVTHGTVSRTVNVYRKEFLCICSNEEDANGIIAAAKQKPQYAEGMDEYEVIEYDLDAHSSYWSEGFD